MNKSKFNKFPVTEIKGKYIPFAGWEKIGGELSRVNATGTIRILALECYPGVNEEDIKKKLLPLLPDHNLIETKDCFKSPEEIKNMTAATLTDDPVFAFYADYSIEQFFDEEKLKVIKAELKKPISKPVLVLGTGAAVIAQPDLIVYADMPRWEIQLRYRKNETGNLGLENRNDKPSQKYKRGFFIDWRVCDKLKQKLFEHINFYLDTADENNPKMVNGKAIREAVRQISMRPFELKPYFDPGPWGGEWMREVCGLDKEAHNYAWCFNCVPEENSILLNIGGEIIEMPAINVVFFRPVELLGEKVFSRYGAEFPIRFDFLDTINGGNLSLQVHPTENYIKEKFSWPYTQDESYYIVDCEPGAGVYLGVKDNIQKEDFERDLKKAETGSEIFPDEKYVAKWPVKKHDHFLIPGGTVHCSGAGCLVLEISSTPYIFTFKLWDWGRLGLDGLPRPISINHGMNVIDFGRTPDWTEKNLINRFETISSDEGLEAEKTGLHELEPIETVRYKFNRSFEIVTGDSVNVLNLVEGEQVIVEPSDKSFPPLTVNYAETFVVPASVKKYRITPSSGSKNKSFILIRAYIR